VVQGDNNLVINFAGSIQATDSDGDTVAATGAFNVTVIDDIPVATGATVNGGTTDEDGLALGIAAGDGGTPALLVATGSVTGLFLSGADAPLHYSFGNVAGLPALSSGGVPLVYSVAVDAVTHIETLTAKAGAAGPTVFTLTLDENSGATQFTLAAHLDHAVVQGDNNLVINFAGSIQATDSDGDTVAATGAFNVTVIDDIPVIGGFEHAFIVAQDNQIANGTYNVQFGADGDAAMLAAVHNGAVGATGFNLATTDLGGGITSVHVTGNGDDYTFYYTTHAVSGGVELDAFFTDTSGTLSNPFFTLAVDPNGTYTFDLESVGALTQVTVNGSDFGASGGGVASLTSPDGQLVITGTDNGGNPLEVKASNNGIAVGHSGLQMDANEDLHLSFVQEQSQVSFIFTQWQSNGTADVKFDVFNGNTLLHEFDINVTKPPAGDTHIVVQETSNVALQNTFTFDVPTQTYTLYVGSQFNDVNVDYDHVVSGGATFTVNSITYNHQTLIPSTDLLFDVSAVDGDGDTATANLQVDLLGGANVPAGLTLTGTSGNDVLVGGSGNDTLIGGAGSDQLTGGAGADHFRYTSTADGGTILNQAGADHILDFNIAQGDVFEISAAAFGGGLVNGTDATGIFSASTSDTFASTSERFHLNTATNTLLYDSNGSAAGGTQIALAVLQAGGTVDAAHIHVVA
jgi:T1SS-143 domain-containing protein